MFVLLCTLAVLAAFGFTMLIHAAFSAPFGDETSRGFHVTSPVEPVQPQAPLAALLTTADLAFFQY